MNYLRQNPPEKYYPNTCLHPDYGLNGLQVAIDLQPIYQHVFNPYRFKQNLICVVDYDMPELNGLILSAQLKALFPVQIIMLTGEADHITAVRAFNDHAIDGFVLKSQADYIQLLLQHCQQLHRNAFMTATQPLVSSLILQAKHHPLQDADFTVLFNEICQKHQIVEYYLIDDSGSFLLLDTQGVAHWLLVRTEEDTRTFAALAEDDEMPALAKKLTQHQIIARYPTLTNITAPAQTWKTYPAQQLKNKPIYYCLVDQTQGYKLGKKKIQGYEEFLMSK